MILNTLVILFIAAFVGLVVLGHMLLLGDLWRLWLPRRRQPDRQAFQVPAE